MPDGASKVLGVKIHGSRYGQPQAPKESFLIYFMNKDRTRILHTEMAPYSLFKRGPEEWVEVKFESPVAGLPKSFWIVVDFRAAQTKGVYVSFDTTTGGKFSRVGLPGMPSIRGELRRRLDDPGNLRRVNPSRSGFSLTIDHVSLQLGVQHLDFASPSSRLVRFRLVLSFANTHGARFLDDRLGQDGAPVGCAVLGDRVADADLAEIIQSTGVVTQNRLGSLDVGRSISGSA